MRRYLMLFSFALLVFAYLLGGCGGGGGSSEDTSQGTPVTQEEPRAGVTLSAQALVGNEITITTENGEQQNPYVLYLPDKRVYFVLWEDWRDVTDADIYGLFMDELGNRCGGEFIVAGSTTDSDNQTFPSADYRPTDGKILVAWQDTRGNSAGGYVYYRSITGVPDDTTCSSFNPSTDLTLGAETAVGFNEIQTYSPIPTANVTNETIGTGDGSTTSFSASTANAPIVPGTLVVKLNGSTVGIDNGTGSITGSVTGSVDYNRGFVTVRFLSAPAAGDTIEVDYSYYTSTVPPTNNLASDDLVARLKPKVEYDKANDRFWIVWVEIRSILKRINEACFAGTRNYITTWTAGDANYVGYIRLAGDTLNALASESGVTGADIIRNRATATVRLIEGSAGGTTENYVYEYFDRIDNPAVSCDPTSGICLITFEADRGRAELTCNCNDANGNNTCDLGENVTDTFTTDNFSGDDDYKHIFAIFNTDINQTVVLSYKVDSSNTGSYYPSVAVDPVTKRFLVAWEDRRDSADNPKIYGQLVSVGTGLYGNNFIISYQDLDNDGQNDPHVVNSKQTRPYVEYDDVNQRFFVIWQDGRNQRTSLENLDLYGQYVDLEGSLRGANHFISTSPANQLTPVIAYNNNRNEFLAVWKDARNTLTTGSDIYAQRFTLGQPVLLLLNADGTTPLAPAVLDFGTIEAGKTASLSFVIKNAGDTTLNLDCVVFSAGSSAEFSFDPSLPTNLQSCDGTSSTMVPGATIPINVVFSPTSEGIYSGQINIRSDGGNRIVSVSGSATPKPVYALQVTEGDGTNDGTLDFGNVKVGNSKTLTIALQNTGNVNINIISITVADPYFSIPSISSFTILPGEQRIIEVTFNPFPYDLTRGSYSSSLTIATDVAGVSVTLNLQGRIVAPVLRIDQTTLDFGQVAVGTSQDLDLTIYNDGDADMNVLSCGTPPLGFSIVSCPSSVPAGGSATITYRFTPTDTITYSGTVTVETDGGNQDITLQGQGRGPKIEVSQTILDFETVAVGLKKTIVLNVSNPGNEALVINGITDPGAPFSLEKPSTTYPISVNPGTSVSILVNFQPTAEGFFTDSFDIQSNAGNVTIQLQGTGKQVIVVDEGDGTNDGTLVLPDVKITTGFSYSGSQQRITITNAHNQPVQFTVSEGVDEYLVAEPSDVIHLDSYTGAISVTFTLNPGESKTLIVGFRPTERGTYTTQLLITTDIAGLQRVITLTGRGTAPVLRIDQTTLDFGQVAVGSSQDLNLTIYNDGDADMNVLSCGTPPLGFSIVNCPSSVPAGGSATITYRFTPTDATNYGGTVTVETDGGNQDITLQGQGRGPKIEVSQTVVDFGYVVVGNREAAQIEITNVGNAELTINQIDTSSLDPAFSVTYTGSLPITIQPGTSFVVVVAFEPSSPGLYNGSFTVRSDAINGDVTINLQGFAESVDISMPTFVDFGTLAVGESTSRNITITNNSTRQIQIVRIDGPSEPFTLVTNLGMPYIINPGESVSLVVSFAPTEGGSYNSSLQILFDFAASPAVISLTGSASTTATGAPAGALVFKQGTTQISVLNFGKVLTGDSKLFTLTLENTGAVDLQIISTEVNIPFRTTASSFTVPASGTYDVPIFFEPSVVGRFSGEIKFRDVGGNEYTLSLVGEGTDVIVQTSTSGVDLSFSRYTASVSPPAGFVPVTGVSFSARGTFSAPLDISLQIANLPSDPVIYKLVSGSWKQLYPLNECSGITDVTLSGDVLSFKISDNSECDSDPASGSIVDPIIIGSSTGTAGTGTGGTNPPPEADNTSGGGCSTSGGSGLAFYLALVVVLLLRKFAYLRRF